jgi:hypothetical protein
MIGLAVNPLVHLWRNEKKSSYKSSEHRHKCEIQQFHRWGPTCRSGICCKNVRYLGIEPGTFEFSSNLANHVVTSLVVFRKGNFLF